MDFASDRYDASSAAGYDANLDANNSPVVAGPATTGAFARGNAPRSLSQEFQRRRGLCEAFLLDTDGHDFLCERRLIEEAHRVNHLGKMLAPIIDGAHLMDVHALRRRRLLLEDFPKNHNLILLAQPELLHKLTLSVNDDIDSPVTYSVLMQRLAPDDMLNFIHEQLDRVALAHGTFTPDALQLIRASEGPLRAAHATSASLEAVRDACAAWISSRSTGPHAAALEARAGHPLPANHRQATERVVARHLVPGVCDAPGRMT